MSHKTTTIHSKYSNNKFMAKVVEFSPEHYYELEITLPNGGILKCPKDGEDPVYSKPEAEK